MYGLFPFFLQFPNVNNGCSQDFTNLTKSVSQQKRLVALPLRSLIFKKHKKSYELIEKERL